MARFSKNTPWYSKLWYTYANYMLLIGWWYHARIYDPIEKFVVKMAYKWKYRKEHREIKRKYLK